MKQVGNILGIVSFIGVVVLFFIMPKTEENNQVKEELAGTSEQEENLSSPSHSAVAFIKVDSLMVNYVRAAQLRDELNASRIKFDSDLSGKQKKLMSDAQSFQVRAATMSNFEAQQRQKELLEREQQLMQLEQDYMQRLAYTEAGFSNEINDSLNAFLAEYVKSHSYEVILSDNQGGAVLWGSKSIDITDEVIDGMNARLNSTQTSSND